LRGRSYVNFIAFTYAKQSFSTMLGPALGPASSGPIVRRTWEEWHYGFSDPALAALLPRNASAPWWTFDPTAAPRGRRIAEAPSWAALAAEVGAGTAPPDAAKRFFSTAMATGRPGEHMAQTGDVLSDSGVARVAHPGGSVAVRGRPAGVWGFGDLSAIPFGLAARQTAHWYLGRWELAPDPGMHTGLGRALPLTWQGRPAYMDHYVPSLAYALDPDALTPCGGAAGNASAAARAAAALACVYGDDIAGVWNLTGTVKAPLFITRGHFYGADPSLAASLGPDGAAAMAPDEATHNIAATLDTLFGLPLALRATFQSVIGLRPTAVFFPRLWHGAPGPGGFTFMPAAWTSVRVVPSDKIVRRSPAARAACACAHRMRPADAARHACAAAQTMDLYYAHTLTESGPRFTAGCCHIVGAVVAGFGAFSLWSMRREGQTAGTVLERRRTGSVASSAGSVAEGDAADESGCAQPRRDSAVY
jgi:hypothetical protein